MSRSVRLFIMAIAVLVVLPATAAAQGVYDGVYFISSFTPSPQSAGIPGAFFAVQSGNQVVVGVLGWERFGGEPTWRAIVGNLNPSTLQGSGILAVPLIFNFQFRPDLTVSYTLSSTGCSGTFTSNIGESGSFVRVFPAC